MFLNLCRLIWLFIVVLVVGWIVVSQTAALLLTSPLRLWSAFFMSPHGCPQTGLTRNSFTRNVMWEMIT